MESKKINQLATSVSPQTSDLTIIGDPITGVSKKITLLQIANLFATTGTVSSVAVTETGDALTITGSPITSTGTINIGFAGDATQYVRGDGALADFPTSTGGGSSVSYYLNSSVSQGTIGGVAYRELSKEPVSGAGTDITASTNGYIASYITDANDPSLLEVPGGNFNCEFYFSVNSNNHDPYIYAELYKYDGSTFTLLGSSQSVPEYLSNGTTLSPYYFAIPVATAVLSVTDRLAIRIYVNVDGRVVTLHTENNHLCQVVTTFSKGLTSLNNLTRQVQFFGTGTSGTDFAISSSTATHTFNLPVASATNTGKLSSTDWSTFNGKVPYTGANANVNLGIYSLTANQLIAGAPGTNNVATFTTADQGNALHLKGSTGDLIFVPYFSPSVGARITAQDTAGSANTPLSLVASTINIVGDLIGKAATFGGNIVQLLTIDSAAIGGSYIALKKQGTLNGAIGMGANTIASNTDTDLGLWATGLIAFQTNSVVRLTIASSGAATFTGSVTASSLIKSGGTSSQFLKADGSVDSSTYLTTSSASSTYVPYTGATGAVNLGANGLTANALAATNGNNGVLTLGSATYFTTIQHDATTTGATIYTTAAASGGGHIFKIGTTTPLTIASTGAATFSSSVGVGGTLSAWGSPVVAMQVGTASINSVTSGANAGFSANRYFDGSGNRYITDGFASNFTQTNGAFAWFTAPSGTAGDAIGFTQVMTITSGGNVGIGTSSPSAGLEVVTDSGAFNALRLVSNRAQSSGTDVAIAFRYLYDTTNYATGGLIVAGKDNTTSGSQSGNLQFYTNNAGTVAERMRITSGGNVIVNSTTDSGYKFQVRGGSSYSALIYQSGGNAGFIPLNITHNVTS